MTKVFHRAIDYVRELANDDDVVGIQLTDARTPYVTYWNIRNEMQNYVTLYERGDEQWATKRVKEMVAEAEYGGLGYIMGEDNQLVEV